MNVHAIVGNGEASPKAVAEALRDVVRKGDVVGVIWNGKPSATETVIYDFLLDDEVPFVMYYVDGDKVPQVFRDAEHGTVQKTRNPEQSVVDAIEGKGKVLFRWNDAEGDDQIEGLFDVIDEGTLVLELTNGLAPIKRVADGEIPEPQDREVQKDEAEVQDDAEFSKEELENMTPISVKRYGERKGTIAKTKKGIIEELFSEKGSDEDDGPYGDSLAADSGPQGEDLAPAVATNAGSVADVDKSEVPQLLRIIASNLIRLANALS